MRQVLEDRGGRPALDRPAAVHDINPVHVLGDHTEVVADQDHRHAEVVHQVPDQIEDLFLDRDVQRRGRLIGDQQVGAAREGHGDHHALALAPGQLVRIVAEPFGGLGDAHEIEKPQRLLVRLAASQLAVQGKRLADLMPDGVQWVERGHGLLKDHGDAVAADPAHGVLGIFEQVLTLEPDGPGGARGLG